MRAPALWRVQLLGGLCVAPVREGFEGASLPPEATEAFSHFRTHKTALLLARLLLYPHRSHSREELADWLWPDAPAERGRANLSQTLLRLRQQFAGEGATADGIPSGNSLFAADHQTIRVCASAFLTDAAQFERLIREARAQSTRPDSASDGHALWSLWDAALQTYRGDLLPGFYDDWIEAERQRLSELRAEAQSRWERARASLPDSPPPRTISLSPEVAPANLKVYAPPSTASLPLTLTRFFGRDAGLAQIAALLAQDPPVRLVTLVGLGGIGKTRLAIEAARKHTGGADDAISPYRGVAFVPLAEVTDAAHCGRALHAALIDGANGAKNDDPLPALTRFLNDATGKAGGRFLLLLDNLEQMGATCSPVVTQLLRDVPALTILATSRQPIGVAGEREVSIGPLVAPSGEAQTITGEAQTIAGEAPVVGEMPPDVALFVDRARLVRPDFTISAQNADAIRELCALMEGVPLALELAAAWARTLSPAQIASRLNNRFELLALRGVFRSDIPKRHQSLRAALAWSYDLLPPSLQSFFAKLSIFRGGWTAEAAQRVTGIRDVSEPLLLLAERSLILAETEEGTTNLRYRMLESLREFAEEQWQETAPAERRALRLRHAAYYEALAREADEIIEAGRGYRFGRAMVAPERENLRAALRFTLAPDGAEALESVEDAERVEIRTVGIRLAIDALKYWPFAERAEYLERAACLLETLSAPVSDPLRTRLLLERGHAALAHGDMTTAQRWFAESLQLSQAHGDERQAILAKKRLGGIAMRTGRPNEAIALWTECLNYFQKTDEPLREAGILNNLATCGANPEECRAAIDRAVALYREHAPGSHFLAMALNGRGGVALDAHDFVVARHCLEEAHDLAQTDGATGMIAVAKGTLAELFLAMGEHLDRADQLLAESQNLFESQGEPPGVAAILRVRLSVALSRRDPAAALQHARHLLRLQREDLATAPPTSAATLTDLARQLRDAGYTHHADQLLADLP